MIDPSLVLRHQMQQAGRFDQLQNVTVSSQQMNQAAVQSGQALGYRLVVETNPTADLMDSMEELSMQFEEKEMKTAGQRKLGENRGPRSAYLTAVEKWQRVLPDMPGGEFMERMLRLLRQKDQQGLMAMNDQALLHMLKKESDDPSHVFAMLEILQEATEGDQSLQELLAAAKRTLEKDQGAEVRAGINLSEVVNANAGSVEEMQGLRDLYRGEILGFSTPQDCFRSLLANRGAGRLAESIDFLFKGLGVDLQSASPSRSPEELRRVLTDLQCVEVLRTVLDKCDALVGKMLSQFGETSLMNGEKMTGKIIDFTEMSFVSAGNIAAFVSSCGIRQLLAQLYFCTTLSTLFRGLSPRLFGEEGGRFRLIDAAQEHLDGLVSLQEDAEKERGGQNGKGAA